MKTILTALTVLTLAGCSVLSTQEQQVQAACASITASVQTLTVYKDKLSASQVETVNQVLEAAYPICGQGEAPKYNDVAQAVLIPLREKLTAIITEVK